MLDHQVFVMKPEHCSIWQDDINTLLQMLSSQGEEKMHHHLKLRSHLQSQNTATFGAFEGSLRERIVSIATIHYYETWEKFHGIIEDVVTHNDFHRKGYGDAVMTTLLADAWSRACEKEMPIRIKLTSHPSRKAAHAFYERHGFVKNSSANTETETVLFGLVLAPTEKAPL